MRKLLQYFLKLLAQIVLWKYRPEIVAITGSAGKTSVKECIYCVLKKHFLVRRSRGNYNNELGVPLTILGLETKGASVVGWIGNFFRIFLLVFGLEKKKYPEIIILEMGVDRPGDMKYLTSFISPKIGVFTAVGEFPVHLEFFPERGKLVEEKSLLLKSLPKKGLAVVNYDDLSVREIGQRLKKQTEVISYGFGEGADLKIINYELYVNDLEKRDLGISFKLERQGSIVPVRLKRVLGRQQAYAAAASAVVGLFYGLNLVEISSGLSKYRSMPGRTRLIKGIKNTWLIDDTYNASPLAASAALKIMGEIHALASELEAGRNFRKIAVLGDMLELGQWTEQGHRQVGRELADAVDFLITVGTRTRFIADEAKKIGLPEDQIKEFSCVEEAGRFLQKEMKTNDIILIKGSRSMRMEKAVKEVMARPDKADKLLVKHK